MWNLVYPLKDVQSQRWTFNFKRRSMALAIETTKKTYNKTQKILEDISKSSSTNSIDLHILVEKFGSHPPHPLPLVFVIKKKYRNFYFYKKEILEGDIIYHFTKSYLIKI